MVGAKDWRALARRLLTKQTFDAVSITGCSSKSWLGSFIAGTAPSFSIKQCANPASNWALFIKRSSTNTLAKLHCCPEKQTASTVHVTLVSSGSWTRLYFPYNQKHTSLETFFPCSAAEWSALMGTLLLSLRSMFQPSWRHEEPWSKKNFQKPGSVYLARYTSKSFFETLAMISIRTNSLTV